MPGGVNSCQVGLLAEPLPRARASEGGPLNQEFGISLFIIITIYRKSLFQADFEEVGYKRNRILNFTPFRSVIQADVESTSTTHSTHSAIHYVQQNASQQRPSMSRMHLLLTKPGRQSQQVVHSPRARTPSSCQASKWVGLNNFKKKFKIRCAGHSVNNRRHSHSACDLADSGSSTHTPPVSSHGISGTR